MKKVLYMFGVATLLCAGAVFAQNNAGKVVTALQQDVKTANQQAKAINACDTITEKISERIGKFNSNRNKHVDNYIAAKEKIENLLTKLEAKGYDTTKVRADLVQYETLLATFSTSYSTYITDLTATQNYACGKSEGEFKAQLQIARTQLAAVRAADKAVKDYWKNTLKPDLQVLRASIANTKATTTQAAPAATNTTTGGTQ